MNPISNNNEIRQGPSSFNYRRSGNVNMGSTQRSRDINNRSGYSSARPEPYEQASSSPPNQRLWSSYNRRNFGGQRSSEREVNVKAIKLNKLICQIPVHNPDSVEIILELLEQGLKNNEVNYVVISTVFSKLSKIKNKLSSDQKNFLS